MGIFARFVQASELAGRARAMRELRGMSDEWLVEYNISPDLLAQGIKSWPWALQSEVATASDETVLTVNRSAPRTVDQAVTVLPAEQQEYDTAA